MTYAKGTSVDVAGSQQEIARVLARYKVDTYSFGARPDAALVEFEVQGFPVRVAIPLPARPKNPRMQNPERGRSVDAHRYWEQQVRECWRALVLLIKANLEAVERGIVKVEQAFMAYLVDAESGMTLGDAVLPKFLERQAQLAIGAGGAR